MTRIRAERMSHPGQVRAIGQTRFALPIRALLPAATTRRVWRAPSHALSHSTASLVTLRRM